MGSDVDSPRAEVAVASQTEKDKLRSVVQQTADALAADRATKFLPIMVAQGLFIGAVAIAFGRTVSAAVGSSSTSVFINVEAHSIAFSALYFWIIPTVIISSIIGVSQTESAIPRILRRFKTDLDRAFPTNNVALPHECLDEREKRVFHGGLYSWRPGRRLSSSGSAHGPPNTGKLVDRIKIATRSNFLSYALLVSGTLTGVIVSCLVPPDGWDCRNIGEVLITLAWILSAVFDTVFARLVPYAPEHRTLIFWTVGVKDLVATLSTMLGIVATQVGVFNRCSCYTLWGRTGVALPEMPDVQKALIHRMRTVYPAVTFTCIGIELIIVPLYVCIRYRHAVRVFLQRDDGNSNAKWLWKLYRRTHSLYESLRGFIHKARQFRRRGERGRTRITEEGPPIDVQHGCHTYGQIPFSEEPEMISVEHRETAANRDQRPQPVLAGTVGATSHDNSYQNSNTNSNTKSSSYPTVDIGPRRRFTENQGNSRGGGAAGSSEGALRKVRGIPRKPLPPLPST